MLVPSHRGDLKRFSPLAIGSCLIEFRPIAEGRLVCTSAGFCGNNHVTSESRS